MGYIFLLYLGPQTVLPLASIFAALIGVLLMFWRHIFGFLKRVFKFIRRKLIRGSTIKPETIDFPTEPKNESSD
jgi:hypothetical protein